MKDRATAILLKDYFYVALFVTKAIRLWQFTPFLNIGRASILPRMLYQKNFRLGVQ